MGSSILMKCLVTAFPHTNLDFLHTNYVPPSMYNEVDRFTNERHSTTIGKIDRPKLARDLLILIG